MKYYVFTRESDKFDDIVKDIAIKPVIRHKIRFTNYLILGFSDDDEKVISYMTIKYGDDMTSFNNIVPDRKPVIGKDYLPIKKPKSSQELT
jgi:hypothetical protein